MKNQIIEKRHALALKAKAILNDAQAEGRALSAEESAKFDAIMVDVDQLDDQIRRVAKMDDVDGRGVELESLPVAPRSGAPADVEYRQAVMAYLRRGKNGLDAAELRSLQTGTVSEGGALTYEEFERAIVEKLREQNVIRQLATVIVTGGDRNIPIEDGEGQATWIGEEAAFPESTGDTFARVVLGAHKLQYLLRVSEELLQDASFNLESYMAAMIGRRLGDGEEAAFVSGNGVGRPTGILHAAPVGRQLTSQTAFVADDLIDLFHSVKRPYRVRGSWVMNDATVRVIRKMRVTGTDAEFLWQPGLQAGEPDLLLGRPVYTSVAAPTIGAGARIIAFGDMSYYTIADRGRRVIQRLNELYAANGQVGFRAYERVDGKIVLSEAIRTMRMASGT